MDGQRIIMNYSLSPSADDLDVMATGILESLPDELVEQAEAVALSLEEFPDEALEQELELDDPFELLALFRSGREISPGVEKKSANDDDVLVLFRRPILDMWCESGEDLSMILRQVIVGELGRSFEFSEDEIEEMTRRHCQGMF